MPRPRTLLIDSRQIEAGDALDKGFRDAAGPEIEQFKRELAAREGAGDAQGEASESALLREVMNTVGRPGRLGEQIRCVVSVSMLTEGWDTNTVTHILGVRAFGTQLLCEQVVGRGLRRQSYDLNPETGLFDVEYADIMGIPVRLRFLAAGRQADQAEAGHARPRDQGARRPGDRLPARQRLSPRPAVREARGRIHRGQPAGDHAGRHRPHLGRDGGHRRRRRDDHAPGAGAPAALGDQLQPRQAPALHAASATTTAFPKQHLFPQIQRLARRWLDEGYLVTKGVPIGAILYQDQLARAAEKIDIACTRASEGRIVAVLDPYNPEGLDAARQLHHLEALLDDRRAAAQDATSAMSCWTSDWEEQLALTLENHPRVLAYAKNQALGFEIPYLDGGITRRYLPDFLVRLDDGGERAAQPRARGQGHQGRKRQGQGPDDARSLGSRASTRSAASAAGTFAEFRDWAVMDEDFAALVEQAAEGGYRLMARSPKSPKGKSPRIIDALKHERGQAAEHSDGGDGELLPARGGCLAACRRSTIRGRGRWPRASGARPRSRASPS